MNPNIQHQSQSNGSYRNNSSNNGRNVNNENISKYSVTIKNNSNNNTNMFSRNMKEGNHSPSNTKSIEQNINGGNPNNIMKNLSKLSPINYSVNKHNFYNHHSMIYNNNGLSNNGYKNRNYHSMINNVKTGNDMQKIDDGLVHDINDSTNKSFRVLNYNKFSGNIKGPTDDNMNNFSPANYHNIVLNNKEPVLKSRHTFDLNYNPNGRNQNSMNSTNNLNRIKTVDLITHRNTSSNLNCPIGRNNGINSSAGTSSMVFPNGTDGNINNVHASMNTYTVSNTISSGRNTTINDVMNVNANKTNGCTALNTNKGVRHSSSNLNTHLDQFRSVQKYPYVNSSNVGRNNITIMSGMNSMGDMSHMINMGGLNSGNYNVNNFNKTMSVMNKSSTFNSDCLSSNVNNYLSVPNNMDPKHAGESINNKSTSSSSNQKINHNNSNNDNLGNLQGSCTMNNSTITTDHPKKRSYRKNKDKGNLNELDKIKNKSNNNMISNISVTNNCMRSDMLINTKKNDQQMLLLENGKNNRSQDLYSLNNSDKIFNNNVSSGFLVQSMYNMNSNMKSGQIMCNPSRNVQVNQNLCVNEQNINVLNGRDFMYSTGSSLSNQNINKIPYYEANNIQDDKTKKEGNTHIVDDPSSGINMNMHNNCATLEKTKKRTRKEREKTKEQDKPPKNRKRKNKNDQNNDEGTMGNNSGITCTQDIVNNNFDNSITNLGNTLELLNDSVNNKISKRKLKANNDEKIKNDEKKRKKRMLMMMTNMTSSYPPMQQNSDTVQQKSDTVQKNSDTVQKNSDTMQQNSDMDKTNKYSSQNQNEFYNKLNVTHENMNNGIMNTYGNTNYLNNIYIHSARGENYNNCNQDDQADASNVSNNCGEKEHIKMMNMPSVDNGASKNIVNGLRYSPNTSYHNTNVNDFINKKIRENNNAEFMRDSHLSNNAQGIPHGYMRRETNKNMHGNLTSTEMKIGDIELYKKEEFLKNNIMNVDAKYVWLFLNKEFNENKSKYAGFLPYFNNFYPNKLYELICKLEEYSLLNFAHIMNSSRDLQRKYCNNLSPPGVHNVDHVKNATISTTNNIATNNNTTTSSTNDGVCVNPFGQADVSTSFTISGYSDGNIDNMLLNNINNNFNELIKNISIESVSAPNTRSEENENSGKVRRRRKNATSARKAKKDAQMQNDMNMQIQNGINTQMQNGINTQVQNNMNTQMQNGMNTQNDFSMNWENRVSAESNVNYESNMKRNEGINLYNNNKSNNGLTNGIVKKPRKPRTSKKALTTNDRETKNFMNSQEQTVSTEGNKQKVITTYETFVNSNGTAISENAKDVLNLIMSTNVGNAQNDSINSKNKFDFVHKENETLLEKGLPNLCDSMNNPPNFPKDENESHKTANNPDDINNLGKNKKVRKYRKKKYNNNVPLEDNNDLLASTSSNICIEEKKKKKKKRKQITFNVDNEVLGAENNLTSMNEHVGKSCEQNRNDFVQKDNISMLADISAEMKIKVDSAEMKCPNNMDAECVQGNEVNLSSKYSLNCTIDDNNEMHKKKRRRKKKNDKVPDESKGEIQNNEILRNEGIERKGKNNTKKKHMEKGENIEIFENIIEIDDKYVQEQDNQNRKQNWNQIGNLDASRNEIINITDNRFNNENINFLMRKGKNMKKLRFPQNNFPNHLKGTRYLGKTLSKNMRLSAINAIKKKYKRFSFCINKVFKKQNINDIIALNENVNNNKELLLLFKKKDISNLKRRNLSFFMGKLQLQKIDMIIMKRIHICLENIKNTLGITCVINNVEKIVNILKCAFRDRLHLMWPLIKFSNKYRLDQYFHLLTKNRNNAQSKFKDTKLIVHQNMAPLIAYFNQRTIDDKIVEHLKNKMKPKRRRRKNKNKDPFLEDKPLDFLKSVNATTSSDITRGPLLDYETARTKANEFTFVGYNQRRLLTQITPYDYKHILNSEFCNQLFTIKWREQQAMFVNHLHFDMVPDNDERRKYFENIYIRYMGYDKKKVALKLENKENSDKLKFKNDNIEDVKDEGKQKTTRKRKTNKNNDTVEKEPKIIKPRRKYERVKPRKSKNPNGNTEVTQNVMNNQNEPITKDVEPYAAAEVGETEKSAVTNHHAMADPSINENTSKRKGRKPGERKRKNKNKNLENYDLTVLKSNPNTVLQASIDFMNPNLFT
ncbi:hypothetical protein, conserved [Plasmodium gonderi]|uniref:Uncharacterized protein n=1 Tax=Plasmodium gonderi TaxID=77519 RepID=A0A1Y1JJR8_PLAGO|nr:hypothetical protein, conserved [Plasmodium gonderi]GAW81645.1 hypothetical protein, conserved [Plasmodium gonderi]